VVGFATPPRHFITLRARAAFYLRLHYKRRAYANTSSACRRVACASLPPSLAALVVAAGFSAQAQSASSVKDGTTPTSLFLDAHCASGATASLTYGTTSPAGLCWHFVPAIL